MERREQIKEILEQMTDDELINIWNEYCEANRYDDDIIYSNDIDELLCGCEKPSDVLNAIDLNEYSMTDDYAQFTIYGLKSFDYIDDQISFEDLARYMDNNEESFGIDEIEELFEEEEEEED